MSLWSSVTRILPSVLAVLLTACVSAPPPQTSTSKPATNSGSRYELDKDSGVLETLDLSKVKPVIPRTEVRTIAGNKSPYTVNGATYRVLENEVGYIETGFASWYGRKFHGHLTSNGEIYDMFQLSAAHTTLPIPSYIRVTNLDNGKSIVARVNDRGPFHPGRIVDLSYAGAVMLDYAGKGTARVRVEALTAEGPGLPRPSAPVSYSTSSIESIATERKLIDDNAGQEFLQVGAFGNRDSATRLVTRLSAMTRMPVFILSETADNGSILHKVRIGPLSGQESEQQLIDSVINAKLGNPFKVRI